MQYKEIFKLKEMLEKANIPFEMMSFFGGYRIAYPPKKDDEYAVCSVIEHNGSYGRESDLLEIMGLLTDDEKKVDSVAGWLTASNVFDRINKHWKEKQKNENKFKSLTS